MGRQTYKINYGTPRFLIGVERTSLVLKIQKPYRYDSVLMLVAMNIIQHRNKGNSLGVFMSGKLMIS